MKNLIIAITVSIILMGCKNKDTAEDIKIQPKAEETPMENSDHPQKHLKLGCYIYSANGNDFKLRVNTIKGDSVIAKLQYTFAEKDKNEGMFNGTLTNDKLFGTYTFISEGKESVRDVAFKIENNQIVEGFGDLNEGGTKFKDTTNITFSTTTPWKKAECN